MLLMITSTGDKFSMTLNNSKFKFKFQICGHFYPLPTGHVTRSLRSELLAFSMVKCNFEAYISVTVQDRRMFVINHQ